MLPQIAGQILQAKYCRIEAAKSAANAKVPK
jgi:hypothetical protein